MEILKILSAFMFGLSTGIVVSKLINKDKSTNEDDDKNTSKGMSEIIMSTPPAEVLKSAKHIRDNTSEYESTCIGMIEYMTLDKQEKFKSMLGVLHDKVEFIHTGLCYIDSDIENDVIYAPCMGHNIAFYVWNENNPEPIVLMMRSNDYDENLNWFRMRADNTKFVISKKCADMLGIKEDETPIYLATTKNPTILMNSAKLKNVEPHPENKDKIGVWIKEKDGDPVYIRVK